MELWNEVMSWILAFAWQLIMSVSLLLSLYLALSLSLLRPQRRNLMTREHVKGKETLLTPRVSLGVDVIDC